MVFRTLGIRQQRRVIPERWQTNEVRPAITPAYCSERDSRLLAQRGGTQTDQGALELRRWSWVSREAKRATICRVPERRGVLIKTAPKICRGLSSSSWQNTYQHMLVRK